MNRGRNPRSNSNTAFRLALAALISLGAGACDSAAEPEELPAAETAPQDEEAISDVAEPEPVRPATQMARHQQTVSSSGIATDPVAEQALRRLRAVDPKELEPLPTPDTVEDEVAPIAHRIARQTLAIRTEPSHGAALRGRIPMGEAFEVFAFVDGEGEDKGCGGLGWAEIGGGYLCLERTRKAQGKAPRTLPELNSSGLTPYYYAKVRSGRTAHVYKSIEDYRAGKPAIDTLHAKHEYAFVGRRMKKGEFFLINERRQVVPEKDMARFYPSTFEGIDLESEPVPENKLLAWTVQWPETPRYGSPSEDTPIENLEYHQRLLLAPEPEGQWYKLADGSGYVHQEDVRRWTLPAKLETAAAGEIWIDVDIEQQMLTVMRGTSPVFATLISSGLKGHTPRGIYRIRLKQATGTMSSDPGDSDVYAVEEVPHVQYFFGGVALHSAFWHNRFGHRMSHGCVNLSPKDAKTVYDMTGPHPQEGWLHVYETESDLGTTVRLHDGGEPVKDRRDAVEPVFG